MVRAPIQATAIGTIPLLVFDENVEMRAVMRGILKNCGVRTVYGLGNPGQLADLIEPASIPLTYIRVADQPIGWKLISELREGRHAIPSTVRIIAYAYESTVATLIQALALGVDDFLAMPLTGNSVAAKLMNTLERPKPFIFRSGYAGPDNQMLLEKLRALHR